MRLNFAEKLSKVSQTIFLHGVFYDTRPYIYTPLENNLKRSGGLNLSK